MVKKVYLCHGAGLQARAEMAEIQARLAEVEARHSGKVHFVGGELLERVEDVEPWSRALGDADAILAVALGPRVEPLLEALANTNIPLLLLALPFSGQAWAYVAGWARAGKKGDVLATSAFADLDLYCRIFRTIHHLRKSKVLVVGRSDRLEQAEAFTRQFETSFEFLDYTDLRRAYEEADPRKAEPLAETFMRHALRVVEPSRDEIRDALRMYLAAASLLRRNQANALAADCAGVRHGELPAFPCVAWSKLNDQGHYGVCEGDLQAAMTQLLLTSYCGKPGFISDPVFDTSRNEVIHSHCAAATAMSGPGGPACPYLVRHHPEDRGGVALQVLLPIGETITLAKFASPHEVLVSTAHVSGNVDSERGWRTKILTRVSDARKMLDNYAGGLHRVVFYGDYVRSLERMGRLMGFRVTREL